MPSLELTKGARPLNRQVVGEQQMSRFREHDEFEARFDEMDVPELRRWKAYWTKHAELLAPKVRKLAIRRLHRIRSGDCPQAPHRRRAMIAELLPNPPLEPLDGRVARRPE